jgi:hypothetical protein
LLLLLWRTPQAFSGGFPALYVKKSRTYFIEFLRNGPANALFSTLKYCKNLQYQIFQGWYSLNMQ